MNIMVKLTAYCDGSCYHKTRQGGIGVYITDGSQEWFISRGFAPTTISRMEGIALLTAIKAIDKTQEVEMDVYLDSEYTVKAFTEKWLTKWQMIQFQGIKNYDMWLGIIKEIYKHPKLKLNFYHIRGHQKDLSDPHVFGNRVADLLASYKNFDHFEPDNIEKILCQN